MMSIKRSVSRLVVGGSIGAAAVGWLTDGAGAQTTTTIAPTTTTTTAPSAIPLVDVEGNQALLFIALVALGVALLWFVPLLYDTWKTNKWRRTSQGPLLRALIEKAAPGNERLTIEEVRQIASAMDRPARGTQGLTQSLLALIIASLIGVAMVATLVSTASDSSDLRKTIVTALVSVLATIAGFYFGARTAHVGGPSHPAAHRAAGTAPSTG